MLKSGVRESGRNEDKMEEKNGKKPKKRRKALTVLLIIAGIAAALVITVAIMGTSLLNRITRTDASDALRAEAGVTAEATDEAPDMTPTPTRTPIPAVSSTDAADVLSVPLTPAGASLPLSEYYHQTALSSSQLAKFASDNASEDYINILLIGADRRAGSGSYNSDTMMIATVDKVNGRLKLTSLLRDMLVEIPGYGYGKLNSAAARGGIELLFDTIEQNLHIELSHYVLVDFFSFVDVVDAMGGVTISMTADEISSANDCIAGLNKQLGVDYLWDGFIFADPGPIKLTGKQALGYARIRHLDSDFVRVGRQYKVLNTIFAKFRSKNVTEQYSLLYELLPLVETNMTNDEILSAAVSALSIDVDGILDFSVPVEGLYQNGKWEKHFVFFCDMPAMSAKLHEFIFDCADEPKEAKLLSANPSLAPRTPTPTELLGITPEPDETPAYGITAERTAAPEETPADAVPAG